jgi:predicted DsbA family dithiol-disulfide isomerase
MLRIDLYTDITCPWCIIGQHRLDKVLVERFPDIDVEIRHHPVLLMPDCPPAGVYIPELLRSRYGVTDPRSAWARPETEARASGLKLDLSRQQMAYPTQAAHALIRAARKHEAEHRLAVAISAAYFLDASNISDADVLADIASQFGFDRAEARALALDPVERERIEQEAAQSAAAGVRSVPHFLFAGRLALNGGCSEDEIATAIKRSEQAIQAG